MDIRDTSKEYDDLVGFKAKENILVNLSKFTSDLESFAQFLNCDFFEIDLQTGETSFYNPESLPEWVNKFLMNSWRHGYFKYYYPELCF